MLPSARTLQYSCYRMDSFWQQRWLFSPLVSLGVRLSSRSTCSLWRLREQKVSSRREVGVSPLDRARKGGIRGALSCPVLWAGGDCLALSVVPADLSGLRGRAGGRCTFMELPLPCLSLLSCPFIPYDSSIYCLGGTTQSPGGIDPGGQRVS